jgi:hypothetical protein
MMRGASAAIDRDLENVAHGVLLQDGERQFTSLSDDRFPERIDCFVASTDRLFAIQMISIAAVPSYTEEPAEFVKSWRGRSGILQHGGF